MMCWALTTIFTIVGSEKLRVKSEELWYDFLPKNFYLNRGYINDYPS